MALGDLVISLSMNTASFESDCGKAQQMADKVMTSIVRTSAQGELAMKKLAEAAYGIGAALDSAGPASDRLKNSFATLNIKSALEIDAQKNKIIAAFNNIANSGVASASEIKSAYKAMNEQISMVEKGTSKASFAFNAFSLSAIANLAKVQIMYQLLNSALSLLASIPAHVIEAIT